MAQVLGCLRDRTRQREAATATCRERLLRLDADWAGTLPRLRSQSALASMTDTAVMLARQIADCPHANLRLEPASVF
ncbi:MAG: hypothetical protein LC121_26970 [Anaerolineae bacterium]|nr:hypothetical protein [Anaerolineae bacterium]